MAATTGDNTGDTTPASTRSGPIKKIIEKVKEDVGNLGKFSPTTTGNGSILFPTGGGGGATDTNDAWHKVLHSVGLGGAGESDSSGAGAGKG